MTEISTSDAPKQPTKTLQEVESIVAEVRFLDRRFRVVAKGDGYLLQLEYDEPDVERPGSAPVRQGSRKWYISAFATETEIVETAWACVLRSQQHVASEHFTYRGRRVYSQHFSVDGRVQLCDDGAFDRRLGGA